MGMGRERQQQQDRAWGDWIRQSCGKDYDGMMQYAIALAAVFGGWGQLMGRLSSLNTKVSMTRHVLRVQLR